MKQRLTAKRGCKTRSGMRRAVIMILLFFLCADLFMPGKNVNAASNKSPYYIMVNRKQNCVTVYGLDRNGKYTVPVKAMVCSVGTNGKVDHRTPTGTFRIYSKYRWRPLYYGVYGQYACRINGPIMFHSVPYSAMSPSSLQYKEFNKLGKAASHGCIRLCCQDAKWIYDNCPNGTKVKVFDSNNLGPLGKPTSVKISSDSKYKNWDPTDSNTKNPWRKVPPRFTGLKNTKAIERCSTKSKLLSGVKAVNFKGQNVKIQISGNYDLDKEGSYNLVYKAKDYLGNSRTQKVTLVVRDTTRPTIYRNRLKISMDDQMIQSLSEGEGIEPSEQDFIDHICGYITAKDSGVPLSDSAIRAEVQDLYQAYLNKDYGTYEIAVYAVDEAGNQSVTKVITVIYRMQEEEETDAVSLDFLQI